MTEQTGTKLAAADGQATLPRRRRLPAGLGPACAGLLLGLLALGPGLGSGYLLGYDMVFVPAPQFNAAVLGTSGTLPRAVPSDAVVAALARALPADVVQKLVLLAIFVLACAGAARLLSKERLPAQLAAGVLYAWNPFVAERLILGQWATLLGYAGLPWVLAVLVKPGMRLGRRTLALVLALVPAAIGGFTAMAISGLVALPAAALGRDGPGPRALKSRLAMSAAVVAVLALLSLPWLVPSLTRHVHTSPAGVAAFAARADTPFGTVGSVLMLGGGWNAQTVPAGYGGATSALWLGLAIAALAGFCVLGRRHWPGLAVAAAVGLVIALLGTVAGGQDLLRSMITIWPGFAVLRDGQQFVAPLALAEAVGFGLVVAWLLSRPRALREGTAVVAAAAIVMPVLFLPGLAWGAAGRLRPVQYPADWLAARRLINADRHAGRALLLPWAAYRRFGWNHGAAVLDPWPRLLARQVVWNDGVQVGPLRIPPEDPSARAIGQAVAADGLLTDALQAHGYRYVIVDSGFGPGASDRFPFRFRLPGCRVVLSGPGLTVYQVPALQIPG